MVTFYRTVFNYFTPQNLNVAVWNVTTILKYTYTLTCADAAQSPRHDFYHVSILATKPNSTLLLFPDAVERYNTGML